LTAEADDFLRSISSSFVSQTMKLRINQVSFRPTLNLTQFIFAYYIVCKNYTDVQHYP
jgi:hypothetical protein